MNKEFYKTPTSIGAVLVIIGFILPWVSFGPFAISGYEIPKVAETFSGMGRSFSSGEASSGTLLYYLLYLIPLLSGYLLYCEYKRNKNFFSPAKFMIFLLSAFVVYKLSSMGEVSIFKMAGIGLWITFGGSVYLLIQAIKELQPSKTDTAVENEIQKAKSTTTNKKMFDFAAYQAKAQEALKLSPKTKNIIIASTSIIILSVGLYFLFHKNSYQKTMSALENNQWEELNYNYEKSLTEIASGNLELDYDETKKLEIAQSIADKMIPIDEFKKKYNSFNKFNLQTFLDLDEEWTALPDLKTKPSHAGTLGIDVDKIYEPYVVFSDSFNLAFVEIYFPDSSMQKFRDRTVILDSNDISTLLAQISKGTDVLLSRIIDTENNDVKSRVEKVKNNLSELKSLTTAILAEQSQARLAELEYEEIDDEPSFAADFFGNWAGYKGEKEIKIVFNSVHGDSLFGYNIVEKNKRSLSGLVIEDADGFTFTLSEPGDEEGYGVFILKMKNNLEYEAIGEWKDSNEPLTESVNIRLQ